MPKLYLQTSPIPLVQKLCLVLIYLSVCLSVHQLFVLALYQTIKTIFDRFTREHHYSRLMIKGFIVISKQIIIT